MQARGRARGLSAPVPVAVAASANVPVPQASISGLARTYSNSEEREQHPAVAKSLSPVRASPASDNTPHDVAGCVVEITGLADSGELSCVSAASTATPVESLDEDVASPAPPVLILTSQPSVFIYEV